MGLTSDRVFPTELNVPKAIADFIAEVSTISDASEKIFKIDSYINRLQDEMNKIDAFKRELPLCMLLLGDSIAAMKEERTKWKTSTDPVLEEFIPLKKFSSDAKQEKSEVAKAKDSIKNREKINWMSSVQLWNSDDHQIHHLDTDSNKKRKEESINQPMVNDLFSVSRNRASGITFDSLKAFANFPKMKKELETDEFSGVVASALTLRTPEIKNPKDDIHSKCGSTRSGSSSDQSDLRLLQQQTLRKQRRCWSPELHRRFVNALQHLGGAQAATPKQIRELMQVDGLTNDEVKSHLQKFRLHTRRVTHHSPQPRSFWKCGESSKASNSQSGSPQGPLYLTGMSRGASDEDEEEERSESQSQLSVRNAA